MNKQILMKELKRELQMRRRVYRSADPKHDKFVKSTEQTQFDTLQNVLTIIEQLKPIQIQNLLSLAAKKKEALGAQTNLF